MVPPFIELFEHPHDMATDFQKMFQEIEVEISGNAFYVLISEICTTSFPLHSPGHIDQSWYWYGVRGDTRISGDYLRNWLPYSFQIFLFFLDYLLRSLLKCDLFKNIFLLSKWIPFALWPSTSLLLHYCDCMLLL